MDAVMEGGAGSVTVPCKDKGNLANCPVLHKVVDREVGRLKK